MRSKIVYAVSAVLSLVFILVMFNSCNERIDAGYEGILVKMYGSEKGVQDVSLVTGRVWYNPLTESVYEFPTYVQTINYQGFTVNAKMALFSRLTLQCLLKLKMA